MGLDVRARAERAGRPAGHLLGRREAIGVDVMQDDRRVAERWVREDVAEQVARELDASRADEHDPGHRGSPAPMTWVRPWLR